MTPTPDKESLIYALLLETREEVGEINRKLTGNGKPGIIVRVDRLEQSGNRHAKLAWVCLTTAIGTAGAYLFSIMKG